MPPPPSSVDLVVALPGLLRAQRTDASRTREPEHADRAPPPPPRPAPALARLLFAAGEPAPEPDGIGAALAPIYGVARQSDWPFAALRAAALGIDPGTGWWLAADPVTLEAGRDDLRLAGTVADLAPDEAAALIATLNAHFRADGLVFVAPQPGAWFVAAPRAQELSTRPLEVAVGRSLRTLLPTGKDAGKWRRWQSEIQMLLHEHPVNRARESAARPVANSVWFWGGGVRPVPAARAVCTFANGGVATALAVHAGSPASPVPEALDATLANVPAAATVVVALDMASELGIIERAWAAPAWSALVRGAIASVTLVADGGGGAVVWTARRPGAWQRLAAPWRAPDLAALFNAARRAAGGER